MTVQAKGQRIQITCPECGHAQQEPALVVSTQCRGCFENFQVHNGQGVPRERTAVRVHNPHTEHPQATPQEQCPEKTPAYPTATAAIPVDARNWWMRLFSERISQRDVICFFCHHPFQTTGVAQSTQCPKCSSYISLRDFEIDDTRARRIETGGNVLIRKTGRLRGTTVKCHHLTVLGEISGSVECTGDFIIRSNARIAGTVRCATLRIERGAKVEFLHPVNTRSVSIDGDVRGQIDCSGPVLLEKRARLHGHVRTTSLVVKSGAAHTGSIEMIPAPVPAP
ncbi:MAG: polymer-forming cytoskeletal protein [Verrucomicrobiota bacterium]